MNGGNPRRKGDCVGALEIFFYFFPKLVAYIAKKRSNFGTASLRAALIMKEPKFYLREYGPRKNSGIRLFNNRWFRFL